MTDQDKELMDRLSSDRKSLYDGSLKRSSRWAATLAAIFVLSLLVHALSPESLSVWVSTLSGIWLAIQLLWCAYVAKKLANESANLA